MCGGVAHVGGESVGTNRQDIASQQRKEWHWCGGVARTISNVLALTFLLTP